MIVSLRGPRSVGPGYLWLNYLLVALGLLLLSGSVHGEATRVLKGHMDPDDDRPRFEHLQITFSGDSRLLASVGDRDRQVIVWDVQTGEKVKTFRFESASPNAAVFSPDGRTLAISCFSNFQLMNKFLVLYEVATWKERQRLEIEEIPYHLAFSPDQKYLAWSGSKGITLVAFRSPEERGAVTQLSINGKFLFSHDSKKLFVKPRNDGKSGFVKVWDVARDKELNCWETRQRGLADIALTADGKTLAVIGGDSAWAYPIQLWDTGTGKCRMDFLPPRGLPMRVAYAADGDLLVVADPFWVLIFKGPKAVPWAIRYRRKAIGIEALSVSPDGKYIATAHNDGTISVFEVPKEKEEIKPPPRD